MGYRRISAWMNRSGILSERGKKFSNAIVQSILKRKKEIGELEPKNKYFPKIYTEYIEYEKYKDCNILLLVHPINYNDNIHLDNVIIKKEIKIDSKIKYNNFLQQLYPNEGSLIEKTNRYYC